VRVPFGFPVIGEEEKKAVEEVLSGHILVHGPKMKEFEAAFAGFTGAKNALAVANCTAGLHLFWYCAGIGPGDEVIVPAQTHIATVHSVEFTGAKPIFVDADPQTGNMTLEGIKRAVSPNTKGIAFVHFLGCPSGIQEIAEFAKEKNLLLLEDCALAVGSSYHGKHAGLWGDAGCFSFYPVKHFTTGEGGMLITNNNEIAQKVTAARAFGVNRSLADPELPGTYDVDSLGINYRLGEIQSAIGIEQLKRVPTFLTKRKQNYHHLKNQIAEIEGIRVLSSESADAYESSYYCMSIVLNGKHIQQKRKAVIADLKQAEIGTSIYYPKPTPLMQFYHNKYATSEDGYPGANEISFCSIALPVGPHLNTKDMDYIAENLKKAIEKLK